MMNRRDMARVALLAGSLTIAACGDAAPQPTTPGEVRTHRTARQMIRPTDGDGWQGNGYGDVTAHNHVSESGRFKVWYTLEGNDAVPEADESPADGVPDFVNKVAGHLDTTHQKLVGEVGLRPPLDDSMYHDRPDYGGDGKFDVYLMDMNDSDGYRVVEACRQGPPQCAGYLAIENDFVGFHYPSADIAIKILTSHEYPHAIQDAYLADIPRFWSEGTATWAEEYVFPEQQDFEGFLRSYFQNLDRPIDAEQAGNLGDSYPYGTAIWPKFLEEKFGVAVIPAIFEQLADRGEGADIWKATDAVLQNHDSTLGEAFARFAVWNGLTGSRAELTTDEVGYADAANYPEASIESLAFDDIDGSPILDREFETRHLTADYLTFPAKLLGGTVEVTVYGRLRFAIVTESDDALLEATYLRPAGALDRTELSLGDVDRVYVVAVNTDTANTPREGRIEITGAQTEMGDTGMGGGDIGVPDVGADTGSMTDAGGGVDSGIDTGAVPDAGSGDDAGAVQIDSGGSGDGCRHTGGDRPVPLTLLALGLLLTVVLRRPMSGVR